MCILSSCSFLSCPTQLYVAMSAVTYLCCCSTLWVVKCQKAALLSGAVSATMLTVLFFFKCYSSKHCFVAVAASWQVLTAEFVHFYSFWTVGQSYVLNLPGVWTGRIWYSVDFQTLSPDFMSYRQGLYRKSPFFWVNDWLPLLQFPELDYIIKAQMCTKKQTTTHNCWILFVQQCVSDLFNVVW